MMKKHLMMMSLMALVVMTIASCMRIKVGNKEWSIGNSEMLTDNTPSQVREVGQETAIQQFDELDVVGPFNVILEQGDNSTVRVEGTAEQLAKMTIYVKDGELCIRRKQKLNNNELEGLRVFVCTPTVKNIELTGSGRVTAPNALNTADLTIDLSGSGDITLAQLTCQELSMEVSGSGEMTTGPIKANEVETDVTGSGTINIAGLTCNTLDNDVTGSGNVTINNINVNVANSDVTGSGTILMRGKVGTHNEDITGSGKVLLE